MRKVFFFITALLISLAAVHSVSRAQSGSAQSFRVIVHADNPLTTLTRAEISDFLLKKTSRWPDGEPVKPVDQPGSASVREAVSMAIHGRTVDRIKNYWQRKIFSGRDVPPPEVADDVAVIAFVQSNVGAIGYIGESVDANGVKTLTLAD